jgi:hypothetical protein
MSCVAAARAPRCPSRVPWATTPSEAIESERARCVVAAEHARGTTRPPTDAVLLLSLPMATGFHRERGGNENGARPGPKRKGVASRTQRIRINSAFHGKPCRWSDPSPGREDGPRPTPNLIDGCGLGLGRGTGWCPSSENGEGQLGVTRRQAILLRAVGSYHQHYLLQHGQWSSLFFPVSRREMDSRRQRRTRYQQTWLLVA